MTERPAEDVLLETERLMLRQFTMSDVGHLASGKTVSPPDKVGSFSQPAGRTGAARTKVDLGARRG